MCGLIWCDKKSSGARKTLEKRYRSQSHRGKQGFAFLPISDDGVVGVVKRQMHEGGILKDLSDVLAKRILFHHRIPTSTVNIPCATHPIAVVNPKLDYNYHVVHNGVIQNDDELKKAHEEMGFIYTTEILNELTHTGIDGTSYVTETDVTFNDSEALAIDLALCLDGKQDKMKAKGSIAFICVQSDKNGKALNLFFGHNYGSPMVLEETDELLCVKSEGHGEKVPEDKLFWYDLADTEAIINCRDFDVGLKFSGNIPHRMGFGATHGEYGTYKHGRVWDEDLQCYVEPNGTLGLPEGHKGDPADFLTTCHICQGLFVNKHSYDVHDCLDYSYKKKKVTMSDEEALTELTDKMVIMEAEIKACQEDIDSAIQSGKDSAKFEDQLEDLRNSLADLKGDYNILAM